MNSFLPLCYHYVRDAGARAFAPRILGTEAEIFVEHIEAVSREVGVLKLEDVRECYQRGGQGALPGRVLLTFDDGLSDHFTAARILSEKNMQGTFFVPSCIFSEALPANPMIVHYGIALFGLKKFSDALEAALRREGLNTFTDAPWRTAGGTHDRIRALKHFLKYSLTPHMSRAALIDVYEHVLLPKHPNILERMHLTREQVREMLAWGHVIGTHSATHISFASAQMTDSDMRKELIEPKEYLHHLFQTSVTCMSYPYGLDDDCFSAQELLRNTSAYQLVFTVKPHANTPSTSPLELGRFAVQSDTTPTQLIDHVSRLLALA